MNNYRNKILELFDEGLVGKDELITNLVNFLSESDAKEFWEQYYDDEDEDYDDEPRWATKIVPGVARF
jgi:hypothetical protein